MAGSFSLAEKLAVAGAFCAIVAMAVGTEADPGVIAGAKADIGDASGGPSASTTFSSTNYWSLSGGGSSAPSNPLAEPLPPPENLPPGFGATPPPDLPM